MHRSRQSGTALVLAALPVLAAFGAAPVGADHLAGMNMTAASSGLAATLAFEVDLASGCCSGAIQWSTGDGAGGTVSDGTSNGAYAGDASGAGTLTDGRQFAWVRTGPEPILVRVTYDYLAAGVFLVTWTNCCPSVGGNATIDVGMSLSAGLVGIDAATLGWTDPSSFVPTGYRIDRSTDGTSFLEVATVGANVTTYADAGLAPGTTYHYRVAALGGSHATATNVAVLTTPAPPDAPAGLVARAGPDAGAVSLAWTAPAGDGGVAITGYNVYRGHESGDLHLLSSVGAGTSSFLDAGLADGVTRWYRVHAVNSVGEGAGSNEAHASTFPPGDPPPALPAGRAATSAAHAGLYTFVFGGRDGDGASLDEILRFDPSANTMEDAGVVTPSPRHGTSAAWIPEPATMTASTDGATVQSCDPMCLSGIISVFGGVSNVPSLTSSTTLTAEILEYDPLANTLTTAAATLPTPRADTAAAYAAGAAYVVGGADANGVLVDVLRFDHGDGTLSPVATLPTPLRGAAAASDGARVWILGGHDGATERAEILVFDPATNLVTDTGARLPTARAYASAVWSGDGVLLFGGDAGGALLDEILRFDTVTNQVAAAGALAEPRCCASAAFDGHSAYVFGGDGAEETLDDTVRFTPGAPRAVVVEKGAGLGEMSVSWTPPLEDGAAADIYRVYRSVNGGAPELAAEVPATTTSFADSGLPDGATVAYRVSAANSAGEGPLSEAALGATWLALAPARPQNVQVVDTVAWGRATIRWDEPAANGGPPANGYTVVRERVNPLTGTTTTERIVPVGDVREFTDHAPVIGFYQWVVLARNVVGNGFGVTSERVAAGPSVVPLSGV